ncbi:YdcF family protein [Cetobacterium somerae]|uniref:YdcF family protein n=1 Tax=Cetobacterium sp. NK01 TaxID=2993530 RepID=UPI0021164923|nr:YdcF family protein [Cetobacterium sp. NK01]MCQ8213073.1 YdcF family protein [Cetobacterium sp. NK01]
MIYKIIFNLMVLTLIIFYKKIFPSSFFINIISILYFGGVLYYFFRSKINKKITILIEVISFFIVSFFILSLGSILFDIFQNKSTPEIKSDYIIILGAGLKGDKPKKVLKYRLDKAIEYYKKYPNTIFIVSGGQGKDEIISESEAMKNYLTSFGIPKKHIIQENRSKTTLENLKFSQKLIPFTNKKVGVISNDFHMYRVKFFANSLNLNITPIYAHTPFKSKISLFMREALAIMYYQLKSLIIQKELNTKLSSFQISTFYKN